MTRVEWLKSKLRRIGSRIAGRIVWIFVSEIALVRDFWHRRIRRVPLRTFPNVKKPDYWWGKKIKF